MHDITTNHPPSLRIFFGTELWERYGFYVVQSLLALYLALHYQWPDKQVYELVGSFTALTYLSPVIGGWIADQFLGQKITILTGTVCLFLSYLVLSLINNAQILPMALAGIAVGTGLLKPNISSLLGNQYPINSPKRDAGYTIFYMGITTGIILGTTLPSQLNHHFGWSVSFASAAIGMTLAFCTFSLGIKLFHIEDYKPYEYHLIKVVKATALILILWSLCAFMLFNPHFANQTFFSIILICMIYLIVCAMREEPEQAKKTTVIGLLCIISVLFWAFYFQMFLSFTLFIARVVEPTFLGINFPPPYYVAIESVGMLFFGFLLSRRKAKLELTDRNLETNNKFLLSMGLMCLSFLMIALLASFNPNNVLLLPIYLVPAYLLISLAELLLSPVGLSAITILAARNKVSTMMGIFFVSLGTGGFLSGKLANLTALPTENLSLIEIQQIYAHGFKQLFFALLLATGVAWILNRVIKRLLGSVNNSRDGR